MNALPSWTEPESRSLIEALRSLRPQLAKIGAAADRDNADPAENFTLLGQAGAARLLLPRDHGGIWDGSSMFGGWGTFIRAAIEVAAGDGPTGQNWITSGLVCREIFDPHADLPDETRRQVADRVLNEGLRLVASNAETGVAQKAAARTVPGGVVLSGSKSFNTNSGGRGMANVGCPLDGVPGRHHLLVDLTHPDVELHDDWDNMGQRGTDSQTITYHDVFVPDGWHYPAGPPSPLLFGAIMLLHGALEQGIGEGALDAAVEYVRTLNR
ncbi:MAG: acyl-CoA dehydrogenase family protein, partial [Candidatus Dormibacteria bacterium]